MTGKCVWSQPGGQQAIPVVWAVTNAKKVHLAEIIAISARARDQAPGEHPMNYGNDVKRSRGCGGATHGKAIIVLNPAEPPLIMRDF